ncbi:hypothetical protein [Winogradskya consettensis]|nr:hypothetical protein [Actinoplanes consettensis]
MSAEITFAQVAAVLDEPGEIMTTAQIAAELGADVESVHAVCEQAYQGWRTTKNGTRDGSIAGVRWSLRNPPEQQGMDTTT